MTKNEALKLALEALECALSDDRPYIVQCKEAITAIKEALMSVPDGAQPEQDGKCKYCTDGCPACDARKLPEQEPVAWADHGVVNWIADKQFKHASLLYTTPPQHKPLTDEETYKIQTSVGYSGGFSRFVGIVRAIEAAHGIKGQA